MSAYEDGMGPVRSATEPRFASDAPLFDGFPGLLFQTAGTESALYSAATLVRSERMGLVLTLRVQKLEDRLTRLAKAHRGLVGSNEHLLVDANKYSGSSRRIGTTTLDRRWIAAQRAVGCRVALTDSPYVPASDHLALDSILTQTQKLGDDVVAVLPVHIDWVTKDVDTLIAAVNAAGVPVAMVLEHRGDPFGLKGVVDGVLRFLSQVDVRVVLLRCDLSSVGAVAWGASAGAIGATTGLRHLYPLPSADKKGGFRAPQIGAFVPWSMGYRSLDKLMLTISADPDHEERWLCRCRFCGGRSLEWIVNEVDAYRHSIAAIGDLGEDVLAHGSTPTERRESWTSRCTHAYIANCEIGSELSVPWKPPDYLRGWKKERHYSSAAFSLGR